MQPSTLSSALPPHLVWQGIHVLTNLEDIEVSRTSLPTVADVSVTPQENKKNCTAEGNSPLTSQAVVGRGFCNKTGIGLTSKLLVHSCDAYAHVQYSCAVAPAEQNQVLHTCNKLMAVTFSNRQSSIH